MAVTDKKGVCLSFKMSSALLTKIHRTEIILHMEFQQCMGFLLEFILSVAELEKRFRLLPLQFDCAPVKESRKLRLSEQLAEALEKYAHESNLGSGQQACQLLDLACDLVRISFDQHGAVLRKGEFIRWALEHLAARWVKVH